MRSTSVLRPLVLAIAVAGAACGYFNPPPAAGTRTAAPPLSDDVVARLDSIARAVVAGQIPPGLAIAVGQGNRLLFERAYGLADIATGEPVGSETIFRIGSVTKQFTAAAILRLVEQGRLSLDDQIGRFVPDYPTKGHRITVRHLLNHTSGIPDYTQAGPPWFSRVAEDLSHGQVLALFRDAPLDFVPGERFRYSNSGYFLLGMIIERVTGQAYGDYVQQELAARLGLTSTIYCPNEPANGHAHGFRPAPSGPVPAPMVSMTHVFYAAGSLCSTAGDLVRWAHALASAQVVSAASYRSMITPAALVGGDTLSYGFGLVPGNFFGVEAIAHGGGQIGYSAALSYYPDSGIAIAVLGNHEAAQTASISNQLSRIVLGLIESVVREVAVPAAQRLRYPGTYDIGGRRIRVLDDSGRLVIQEFWPSPMHLLAQGNDEFRAQADPSVRVAFRVDNDRARSLTLHLFGAVIEGRRVEQSESLVEPRPRF